MESQSIASEELLRQMDSLLMLEPGATRLDDSGIRIRGPWGDFISLGALGDGFQATLGWIVDLFGWSLAYRPELLLTDLSGIVLLDELEQHLHPQWQREIVGLLSQQFPRVQFIATSHSPMCALGTTALPPALSKIVRLRQTDDHVEAVETAIPKSQRADQVLTSPLFGLYSASGFDVAADIERYSQLKLNQARTARDEAELKELEERLGQVLGPFADEWQRKIEEAMSETLIKEAEHLIRAGRLSKETLDYQIRHTLRKVLGEGNSE